MVCYRVPIIIPNFQKTLNGYTRRVVVSILDDYKKIQGRMRQLKENRMDIFGVSNPESPRFQELMSNITKLAGENGMEIQSCSENGSA